MRHAPTPVRARSFFVRMNPINTVTSTGILADVLKLHPIKHSQAARKALTFLRRNPEMLGPHYDVTITCLHHAAYPTLIFK